MDLLSKEFDVLSKNNVIDIDIPDSIVINLNPKFELREYQNEAIKRLLYYLNEYDDRQIPSHLLFEMATGSGKTLIMAASILYLYEQGYRDFLFFVNSTNIIEKTRDNFLNSTASKYLFSDDISFGPKNVRVQEVDNFESGNREDINIVFTTIQGLHRSLNTPEEDSVTYEDFEDREVVLISDEAHHLNALTKSKSQRTQTDEKEINTWERTVNKIFNSHDNNILLEFTATAELDKEEIREKYKDKVIYRYNLKEFRKEGFSKEVDVLRADLSKMERALQAITLSQYRRKVAEKNGILLKPVVLMKSNRVTEPSGDYDPDKRVVSKIFKQEFHNKINNLKVSDLKKIKKNVDDGIIFDAFKYFEENNITLSNLVEELKNDFNEDKSISIDSKDEKEKNQILINTLEDLDNEIRVIFAVKKLNEGWDVLNLFDIVRLYGTRDARYGIPGETTTNEAQLIGRGARYFPFKVKDDQEKYKRKYDDDVDNELRILEKFYYHSPYNVKYIQEIKQALREEGVIPEKYKKVQLKVKDNFKKTSFWKNGVMFLNERIKSEHKDIKKLSDTDASLSYKHSIKTGRIQEVSAFEEDKLEALNNQTKTKTISLPDLGSHILQKAIQKINFYQFSNLLNYFPHLTSVDEFISSNDYLNNIDIEVTANKEEIDNLTADQKLEVAVNVLETLSKQIKNGVVDYKGSKEFKPLLVSHQVKDKTLKISIESENTEKGVPMSQTGNSEIRLDLKDKDWYVYNDNFGTSEEKYFVKFISNVMDELQEKYEDIYLVRNERLFKIYRFSDGKATEPDFLLFLKEKGKKETIAYQLFIEPKGGHLLKEDKWKEDFLQEIEDNYEIKVKFENKNFRLIGMPFYNEDKKKKEFKEKFDKVFKLN